MIKKLALSLLFLSVIVFPQEKQNPNVELPDFVITGRDIISIQKAKKIKPDLVSTVSKDFFKPLFSPDELGIEDITNPVSSKLDLFDTLNNYNGYVNFEMGGYTLPKANIVYSIPFSNGIFNSFFNGNNTLNYLENSAISEWNGGLNFSYFVNNDIPFLGGTKFKLHGDYGVSAFKFFASKTPDSLRHLNTGNFSFDLDNLINRDFLFSAKILDQTTHLPLDNFSENLLNLNAYSEAKFSGFNIGADFNLKNQFLTVNRNPEANRLNEGMTGFFNIRPVVGLNISNLLKLKFGFNYAKSNSNNFFGPYASLGMQLNKNLSLFGEIDPHAEFITNGDFLRENRYNIPENTPNVFLRKKFAFNSILKYEYDRYFEIDAGANFFSADDFPYFSDLNNRGKFDVSLTGAKGYSAFFNLLFHAGPYGIFYGNANLNSTKDGDGHFIPYYPNAKLSLVYGYTFVNGKLNTEMSFNFYSKQYADIKNTEPINSYIDMGLKIKYQIISQFQLTFEIDNLFNHNNYLWHDYKEMPLNVLGGFSLEL